GSSAGGTGLKGAWGQLRATGGRLTNASAATSGLEPRSSKVKRPPKADAIDRTLPGGRRSSRFSKAGWLNRGRWSLRRRRGESVRGMARSFPCEWNGRVARPGVSQWFRHPFGRRNRDRVATVGIGSKLVTSVFRFETGTLRRRYFQD